MHRCQLLHLVVAGDFLCHSLQKEDKSCLA